jgi:hypothetical protein
MATIFTKVTLSGAINNTRQILVSATTSGSATLIHSSVASITTASIDEVWLYAYNDSTSSVQCSVLWGGTTEPNDVVRVTLPSKNGRTLIADGKLLYNSLSISAYTSVSNIVTIDGFVNRITTDTGVAIDPFVTAWTQRVVTNGGSTPSTNTQVALTTFYQSLVNNNIFNKMIVVNPFVPDNLSASLTPLIFKSGNSLWTNTGPFTSGDLTVGGLKGDASTKYLKTGIFPNNIYSSANDNGITTYVSSGSSIAENRDVGCITISNPPIIEFSSDTGGNTLYDCYSSATGRLILTTLTPLGVGFYSANRTSATSQNIYAASSVFSFTNIASGSGSPGASLPNIEMYVFGINSAGALLYPSGKIISFVAIHNGLSSSEAQILFNAVQTLRQNLGGGFV